MPLIKVWCLPRQNERSLRKLHTAIVAAVVSVHELKITDENGVTLLIEITGPFERLEQANVVLKHLARSVGKAVNNLYPKAKTSSFVQLSNSKRGFWTSHKQYPEVQKVVPGTRPHVHAMN